MKVLKDNYTNIANTMSVAEERYYPRKMTCEWCGSELEYDESDIKFGEYGLVFVDCPLCNKLTIAENDKNELRLTKDNIEFPTHFHLTSEETGAKPNCTNDYVRKRIREAIEYFRKNKDEFSHLSQFGDTFITVHRFSGDESYEVWVTNKFYNTVIPFELADY